MSAVTSYRDRKRDRIDALAAAARLRSDASRSLGAEALRRLLHNPVAILGALMVTLFVVVAILAPVLASHDPYAQDLSVVRPGEIPASVPGHFMGVDNNGRDVYSRLLYGARSSLLVGVVSTLFGLTFGILLGLLSGAGAVSAKRWGKFLDAACMRLVDMMLSVPQLLLAISVAAVAGASSRSLMIAIGVVQVPIFARLLRGAMIAQGGREYVLATESLGVTKSRIVLNHILPNSVGPVIVQATLSLATAIIEAAALAFLGLGDPDPSVPEWGRMLATSQSFLTVRAMLAFYPCLCIVFAALGFTLLGESAREALDPRFRR